MDSLGFGGGCHWCTESVFLFLKGVDRVRQGWISSEPPNDDFSEAVLLDFDDNIISTKTLIHIHLTTHSATSNHPMRAKYRSAIYYFSKAQEEEIVASLAELQKEFDSPLVTEVLPHAAFKENEEQYREYYSKNRGNTFCDRYIEPKKQLLQSRFNAYLK